MKKHEKFHHTRENKEIYSHFLCFQQNKQKIRANNLISCRHKTTLVWD
jgi:hypothetical protein